MGNQNKKLSFSFLPESKILYNNFQIQKKSQKIPSNF